MNLPDVTDPRWRVLVTGKQHYPLQNLATQMLITRLRLRTRSGQEPVVAEAIETAWAFFARNAATTGTDLAVIFGSSHE